MTETEVLNDIRCYHCGQPCEDLLWLNEKSFCCYGCKTVYEILQSNELCEYYQLDSTPGTRQDNLQDDTFLYLDESAIRKKVIQFDSPEFTRVRFYIPAIHCISCIWLLENMQKLSPGILKSEVHFAQKVVMIDFDPRTIRLSTIAQQLGQVGYFPQINLDTQPKKATHQRKLVLKLSVAGFCFGNVMLFSFPEYLGLDHNDQYLLTLFSWLNLVLAVPVLLFSATDYFTAAAKSFRQKQINIDVPIAIGLLALFLRSMYDIITATGPGYLDSFTGLVFFLLIGRWFQNKTYESLSFDRDYASYFPLAVQKLVQGQWKPVIIYELQQGDEINVRNMEIVPADSILLSSIAYIDYSFVTGESKPVKVNRGEKVYAGGRLIGQAVQLIVENKTEQSQLTSLWNHEAFRKPEERRYQKIIDRSARVFTWVVLGIAVLTAGYWYTTAPGQLWLVITSVLMVACPCALALAAPFTYGSVLRAFGQQKLYLKNADIVERMATINSIVFDKTGTVTTGRTPEIVFSGSLDQQELGYVKILTSHSTHPLSTILTKSIHAHNDAKVEHFREIPGQGIEGTLEGTTVRIGSAIFTGYPGKTETSASHVFIAVNGEPRGYFTIHTTLRKNMQSLLSRLNKKCQALLSGDSAADKAKMEKIFPAHTDLLFNQSPHDKLAYIQELQQQGKKVLMIGDGLNDSGAFRQSDVGFAVTDDTGVFTPACDGIVQGDQLPLLDRFLQVARASTTILKISFGISFSYNIIALSFAVTGNLTPLVAAILMPVSSISVVSFSSLAVRFAAARAFNKTVSL